MTPAKENLFYCDIHGKATQPGIHGARIASRSNAITIVTSITALLFDKNLLRV